MAYKEDEKNEPARKLVSTTTTRGANRNNNSTNYQQETVEDVKEYPIMAIEDRGIDLKTAKAFAVRTALDPQDNTKAIAIYFPYSDQSGKLCGYKKRDLTKSKKEKGHFTVVGRVDIECQLFGTGTAKKTAGRRVVITEGEFDAMIVWQAIKEHSTVQEKPSVLSIGLGTANAVKHIGQKKNIAYVKKFDNIVLAFDNDHADAEEKEKKIKKGKEATAEVYGLIPEIMVAPLPEGSDPVDMAREQGLKELFWAVQKPIRYTPEGFIQLEDIYDDAIAMPTLGRPYPWKSVTKKTLGRREGEGVYIGAGVKMGKSTFLDKMVEHITQHEFREWHSEDGEEGVNYETVYFSTLDGTIVQTPNAANTRSVGKVKAMLDTNGNKIKRKAALFKFEEQPAETLKKVAGKMYKKDFSNPEKIVFINNDGTEQDVWGDQIPAAIRDSFYTQEDLKKAVDNVGGDLILYNNYGRAEWEELKGAIRHAVLVEHVKDVFIDPITRLTAGMTASEANTELEHFADEISKMAQDLGFTYYCFCHLKAPDFGQPHEEGGVVKSAQFRGSRAMMQACFYMFGLEGNKSPDECERVQNTRWLKILDDRKYGRTAKIPLFYDVDTGDFVEPPEGFLDQDNDDPDTAQTLIEWSALWPNGFVIDDGDGNYT